MAIASAGEAINVKPAKRVVFMYALVTAAAVALMTGLVRVLNAELGINETALLLPWLSVFVVGSAIVLYAYLWRWCTHYSMSETHITASTGILAKKQLRIPLSRVTNYWIKRTFIERMLGLADVFIDTAGGNDVELVMVELTKGDANAFYHALGEFLKASPIPAELSSQVSAAHR